MCTTVFTDDAEIWTVGKLRELLGADNVIEDTGYKDDRVPPRPLEDRECLCWVGG